MAVPLVAGPTPSNPGALSCETCVFSSIISNSPKLDPLGMSIDRGQIVNVGPHRGLPHGSECRHCCPRPLGPRRHRPGEGSQTQSGCCAVISASSQCPWEVGCGRFWEGRSRQGRGPAGLLLFPSLAWWPGVARGHSSRGLPLTGVTLHGKLSCRPCRGAPEGPFGGPRLSLDSP